MVVFGAIVKKPLKEAMILSEEHKAVLLVVIGYRQKGGVSKRRVGEILGLEASSTLDDLLSRGLIYCDPSREGTSESARAKTAEAARKARTKNTLDGAPVHSF